MEAFLRAVDPDFSAAPLRRVLRRQGYRQGTRSRQSYAVSAVLRLADGSEVEGPIVLVR
jgi:hypothetical protein